ncbi:MAG: four helix bundle suffix domain-containing protein [Bacteroidaceae bacterium]|nr:four helix bundle suffix domain-containing protein [Bacteroidaceae bacterium]
MQLWKRTRFTLIHQCDVLLKGLIGWKKRDFIERGGIKEEMYRARVEWMKRNMKK